MPKLEFPPPSPEHTIRAQIGHPNNDRAASAAPPLLPRRGRRRPGARRRRELRRAAAGSAVAPPASGRGPSFSSRPLPARGRETPRPPRPRHAPSVATAVRPRRRARPHLARSAVPARPRPPRARPSSGSATAAALRRGAPRAGGRRPAARGTPPRRARWLQSPPRRRRSSAPPPSPPAAALPPAAVSPPVARRRRRGRRPAVRRGVAPQATRTREGVPSRRAFPRAGDERADISAETHLRRRVRGAARERVLGFRDRFGLRRLGAAAVRSDDNEGDAKPTRFELVHRDDAERRVQSGGVVPGEGVAQAVGVSAVRRRSNPAGLARGGQVGRRIDAALVALNHAKVVSGEVCPVLPSEFHRILRSSWSRLAPSSCRGPLRCVICNKCMW